MAGKARPVLDRFVEKFEIQEDGCFGWTAATKNGYGVFGLRYGVQVLAHRFAYETFVGPIPEGMTLDHLCRNRRCVNPDHLEPVTNQENLRRGKAFITHCPQGHPYDDENTYLDAKGHRHCRECQRQRLRSYRKQYPERFREYNRSNRARRRAKGLA